MSQIVSRQEWLDQRMELLAAEKQFSRQRDALSAQRRDLPWVALDQDYIFTGPYGDTPISDLFGDKSQLIIYHFMYGIDWDEGCPSCSFWADNFNGTLTHLAARDAAFAVISLADIDRLSAYKKRMGWDFTWLSAKDTSFNQDFAVSFSADENASGAKNYNFGSSSFPSTEAPGISVFAKDEAGQMFHTYSTFSRGLDMMNGAYHYMDLLPKGRDEGDLPYAMAWLKRHDAY